MNIMGTLLNKFFYIKSTLINVKLISSNKKAFCVKRKTCKLGYKIYVKNRLFNGLKTKDQLSSYSLNELDVDIFIYLFSSVHYFISGDGEGLSLNISNE